MFVCAEHPVAERCGNRVAVYFDFALGSLPHSWSHLFAGLYKKKDVCVCFFPLICTNKKEVKVGFFACPMRVCTHFSVCE